MKDLVIMAALYAKLDREDELRQKLRALVRADSSNQRYELFEQQENPRRFLMLEYWKNTEERNHLHTFSNHIERFQQYGFDAVESIEFLYRLNRVD